VKPLMERVMRKCLVSDRAKTSNNTLKRQIMN
jgi:hypothetical protein